MDDQTINDEVLSRDMLSKIFFVSSPFKFQIWCKQESYANGGIRYYKDSYFTHWHYKNHPWLPSNGILLSSQFLDNANHTLKLFDNHYQKITLNYPKYSIKSTLCFEWCWMPSWVERYKDYFVEPNVESKYRDSFEWASLNVIERLALEEEAYVHHKCFDERHNNFSQFVFSRSLLCLLLFFHPAHSLIFNFILYNI